MRSTTRRTTPLQIKEFIHNFIRVFNKFVLKLENCSSHDNNILKKVSQVSCPIQLNRIDCGLFAVVICLHIFEGTQIGPHIFTCHEIMKLRTLLPRLLVKDRNESYHDICAISHQGTIPTSPLGGVELPQTIKLIAGGLVVGTISFKPTRYHRKPLSRNLIGSSSSEDEDDPKVKLVVAERIDYDNHNVAQSGGTSDPKVRLVVAERIDYDNHNVAQSGGTSDPKVKLVVAKSIDDDNQSVAQSCTDPKIKLVVAKSIDDDNHNVAQSGGASDPKVKLVVAKSIDDDNHNVAQSGGTSDDTDSLSYGNEDYRTTSKMGLIN